MKEPSFGVLWNFQTQRFWILKNLNPLFDIWEPSVKCLYTLLLPTSSILEKEKISPTLKITLKLTSSLPQTQSRNGLDMLGPKPMWTIKWCFRGRSQWFSWQQNFIILWIFFKKKKVRKTLFIQKNNSPLLKD